MPRKFNTAFSTTTQSKSVIVKHKEAFAGSNYFVSLTFETAQNLLNTEVLESTIPCFKSRRNTPEWTKVVNWTYETVASADTLRCWNTAWEMQIHRTNWHCSYFPTHCQIPENYVSKGKEHLSSNWKKALTKSFSLHITANAFLRVLINTLSGKHAWSFMFPPSPKWEPYPALSTVFSPAEVRDGIMSANSFANNTPLLYISILQYQTSAQV